MKHFILREQSTGLVAKGGGKVLRYGWAELAEEAAMQWTMATAHMGGDWRAEEAK
tara:strand:+ start:14430 stop:14594 length:165 start_codon:yes stop_codon:yes gene_type:complete